MNIIPMDFLSKTVFAVPNDAFLFQYIYYSQKKYVTNPCFIPNESILDALKSEGMITKLADAFARLVSHAYKPKWKLRCGIIY